MIRTASLVLLLAFGALPARALTHQEVTCQMAIGRAGQVYLAAELAAGARCRMAAMVGKDCDSSLATERHAIRLRRTLDRCAGVNPQRLVPGGCAETARDTATLADCLTTQLDDLVEDVLTAEFGDPP